LVYLIGRAINIEDQYKLKDGLGINLLEADKVTIYEVTSSSTVQECLDEVKERKNTSYHKWPFTDL